MRSRRADALIPALSISAAVVHVPSGRTGDSADGLGALIATLKSSAKRSATHIATLEYGDGAADISLELEASQDEAARESALDAARKPRRRA
jgi:hypothetical protein